MSKKCPDPEWLVYIEDVNNKTIRLFNVFHSRNFLWGCKNAVKKYGKPEQIAELKREIRSWAIYSFKSKCEYEIVLTGWIHQHGFNDIKIDVFDQLNLNWDAFCQYVIDHKAYFKRRGD